MRAWKRYEKVIEEQRVRESEKERVRARGGLVDKGKNYMDRKIRRG
jgi:hypothetical protein